MPDKANSESTWVHDTQEEDDEDEDDEEREALRREQEEHRKQTLKGVEKIWEHFVETHRLEEHSDGDSEWNTVTA